MERNLIIVRGIPGSGKTTFAEMICKVVFSADDYHTDKDGNYNWKLLQKDRKELLPLLLAAQ